MPFWTLQIVTFIFMAVTAQAGEVLSAPPAKETSEASAYLFGEGNGVRKSLADRGFDFYLTYKGELSQNLQGGIRHGTSYLENIDLKVDMDGEKIFGVRGNSIFLYGLVDRGSSPQNAPSKNVGTLLGVSNIETSSNAAKLYEIFIQQNFFEDQLSFLFGLHDLNSEFYVTETSALFFNPSFGIAQDLAQTGVSGPSIFPNASLALRIKGQWNENIYLQTAAFSAQANDPDTPQANLVVRGPAGDGALFITELGYLKNQGRTGKYAVGTWSYSRKFDQFNATDTNAAGEVVPSQNRSFGSYILVDQKLSQDFAFFFRYGIANPEVNAVTASLGTGIVATGLLPGRPLDRCGFGYIQAKAGSIYKDQLQSNGISPADAEEILELNYRIELTHGIALQPDYQKIIHGNLNAQARNAEYLALRTEINF